MAAHPGDAEYAPLTIRLAAILALHAHGWTYDQIGDEYGLKGATIRDYLRQARQLLGADTVDEAIQEAVRRGIIDLTEPRPEPGPRWTDGTSG